MDVTLLYFAGCPHWQTTDARLAGLATELGLRIERRRVETVDEAVSTGFRGSPTILVDGRDPFATGAEPVGLACRIYETPDGPQGSPTVEQLRTALGGVLAAACHQASGGTRRRPAGRQSAASGS